MKSFIVPDAAVDVLQNWIEQDGAECAVKELDSAIDFLMTLNDADDSDVLRHLRTLYVLKRELSAFLREKGGGES